MLQIDPWGNIWPCCYISGRQLDLRTNFNYKNYKNNQKVIILAKRVAEQANSYRKQLKKCQKRLNKNKYIIF